MICQYISRYLLNHKRLTVPNLGTFLVNPDANEILFFELLKHDDGVLRQMLVNDGYTQIDAAGAIDRFVFEVRHRVESGGTYILEGIGRMSRGFDGLYRFEYDPNAGQKIAVPAQSPDEKVETSTSARELEPQAPDSESHENQAEINPTGNQDNDTTVNISENGLTAAATSSTDDQAASKRQESDKQAAGTNAPDTVAEDAAAAATDMSGKTIDRQRTFADDSLETQYRSVITPESYVKGLRYGKPVKTAKDDIRYVSQGKRRRVDKFLIIAIVAAALAIAAILYGYFNNRAMSDDWMFDEDPIENVQPEQTQSVQAEPDAE